MDKRFHGFKASFLLFFLTGIFFLIFLLTIAVSMNIWEESSNVRGITSRFVAITNIADRLRQGSDILSENVRYFAVTGDIKYLNAYFLEMNVNKSRNSAIEELQTLTTPNEIDAGLMRAMELSSELLDHEYYSMKLISVAMNINNVFVPLAIQSVELQEKDALLSKEEMRKLALEILFDDSYHICKDSIYELTNNVLNLNRNTMQKDINKLQKSIHSNLIWLISLLCLLLLLSCFIIFIIIKFLLQPLNMAARVIPTGEKISDAVIVYETNALFDSYNMLIEDRKNIENVLKAQAEKDPLTGLLNRFALINRFMNLTSDYSDNAIAFFSFDLNFLKKTNDTYGHLKGDELIKNAALCIYEIFCKFENSECFRTGGDEFTSWVINITQEEAENLVKKFKARQVDYNVSIAAGYVWYNNVSEVSLDTLFEESDNKMYEDKKRMRAER